MYIYHAKYAPPKRPSQTNKQTRPKNNKIAKWHCGRHTLWLKKRSKPWYMNDFWLVVSEKKM